ncbi:MAG: family 20 glycosylhydrolase [Clostridia bacterium]|nr:family 20 glycosylhydrolase [Clostridia bacterium]
MQNKKTVALNFQLCAELAAPLARFERILGFTTSPNGITVTATKGEKNGVVLRDGKAEILYVQKHYVYRALGVLVEQARKSDRFEIFEDTHFECLSVMIDTSRCAVPRVETVYRMIDYLAVMGYSMVMLYTEDTVTLEGRPYFGYMRGRYTCEDLRAIDDYAFALGIEVIPCLECYGHMDKYLIWREAKAIKDTGTVLMAREEQTFEFVEQLIATVSSCFRSKRIHIGMDEAWDMGRGKFLDKHGYVPPFQIFNEYMERLIAITNKYGLKPMMWSDMYFRVCNNTNTYYDESIVIPPEVAEKIPKEVELVFWHYGEKLNCDEYMLEKHQALGRKTIYAGGTWSWIGHFPEHNLAMYGMRYSLNACRKYGVREAMATVWKNDNAECDWFADLFGLSFFAELCYDQNASDEKLKARFECCTGGDYDAFYAMSYYHSDFAEKAGVREHISQHFHGKPLFWQDVLEGLYDTYLFEHPMSGHYAACAAKMHEVCKARTEDPWLYLYDYAYRVFDYLATKTLIAEMLQPAYQAGDKAALAEIADTLLPTLQEKTRVLHQTHKAIWFANSRIVGWANMDVRYAGVVARCDTAIALIRSYLDGKTDVIEELEVERLEKPLSGFLHYSNVVTPNIKI